MTLTWTGDVALGSWLSGRLDSDRGLGRTVPAGFEAYARVLHPVRGAARTTWAEVCAWTGRTPHAQMQWESIVRPAPHRRAWEDDPPRIGHLEPTALQALCTVLGPPETDCVFGLWEGYGWIHGATSLVTAVEPPDLAPPPHPLSPAFPRDEYGPRLHLPARAYLLFRGPLSAATEMGHHPTPDWFLPQSPNLMWPLDRSWVVVSEIDFDSTLVGGPADLIAAVLDEPSLEAWPITRDADLTVGRDRVNR